jgi:hypothetical protein
VTPDYPVFKMLFSLLKPSIRFPRALYSSTLNEIPLNHTPTPGIA